MTLSIGAVTFVAAPLSVEVMIKRADEAMYSVKKSGKNGLLHQLWPAQGADGESDEARPAGGEGHTGPKTASHGVDRLV